jgi:hypothetical protein
VNLHATYVHGQKTCRCVPNTIKARDESLDERDLHASVEVRKVCLSLKCPVHLHATYSRAQKKCRCVPNTIAVRDEIPELEKRTSCQALHCAAGHHAVYSGTAGNCKCVPNGIRGGKRGLEVGMADLEKRYTKATCATKSCGSTFLHAVWNSKDHKCLCVAT